MEGEQPLYLFSNIMFLDRQVQVSAVILAPTWVVLAICQVHRHQPGQGYTYIVNAGTAVTAWGNATAL